MLRYISARSYKKLYKLNKMWNRDFKSLFPLNDQIYKKRILDDPNTNLDASFIALYDDDPVGFIFVKTWAIESGLLNGNTKARISLIFVKKELRNMGIGSDMFKLALAEIKKYKTINTITVGEDLFSIFNGVPSELSIAPVFFMNKGFIQKDGVVDMIKVVREKKEAIFNEDVVTNRIATEEEKDLIIRFCIDNGYNKEAFLIDKYYEKGGSGRRIIMGMENDKIAYICRFNDLNRLNFQTSRFLKDKRLASIMFIRVDKSLDQLAYKEKAIKAVNDFLSKRNCKKIVLLNVKNVSFYKSLGYSAYKYYLRFEYKI